VLVADATQGLGDVERELLDLFAELKIPHLVAFSKADLLDDEGNRAQPERLPSGALAPVYVSAKTGAGIQLLKDRLASIEVAEGAPLVRDLLSPGDVVVLVTPIDESAPKGRLILPQVQTLRDILDADAIGLVVKETELAGALASLAEPPAMVITDSQAFAEVAEIVPEDIPLTSFSILMARHKGFLEEAVEGVVALQSLGEGDSVLVAEGCTHDRKCNDIATVKIPRWLEKSTGAKVDIQTSTGFDFPQDVSGVRAVVHCGGCMLNAREIAHRRAIARACGVPFTNYGLAIASMLGILKRSLSVFPDLAAKLHS
ncbi:MAG: [Actinomycetaceae bacterium]|nr:[FeFe] hydrogenase H-cluster maturation GTPase HydF [Actinomycetaceae bacterium]